MDRINILSTGEKLVAGGGILMFLASLFFKWWTYSTDIGSFGYSGWGDPGQIWGVLAALVSVGLAGIIIAIRFGNMNMPALPTGWTLGMVFGAGAGLVVVLMLLKAWRISAVPVGGFGIGFFLGVIAVIAIAAGGYMLYAEEKAGGRILGR